LRLAVAARPLLDFRQRAPALAPHRGFFGMDSLSAPSLRSPAAPAAWRCTSWRGEDAYTLEAAGWRAVVSLERGRLVHFGPAGAEANLLFVPGAKDHPLGWGGHRVWLGPQAAWRSIWPPADAWDNRPPECARAGGARLELAVGDAGDGWARITRAYALHAGRLSCGVIVHGGGARAGQVMQVFQVPEPRILEVRAERSASHPWGCALLPPAAGRGAAVPVLELPPQAIAAGSGRLRLRRFGAGEKLGFQPQDLVARFGTGPALRVSDGISHGPSAGSPDLGLTTQVYLGAPDAPLFELEQMSPLYAAGAAAEFSVELDLVAE
jgi:hypothetical protein